MLNGYKKKEIHNICDVPQEKRPNAPKTEEFFIASVNRLKVALFHAKIRKILSTMLFFKLSLSAKATKHVFRQSVDPVETLPTTHQYSQRENLLQTKRDHYRF